MEKKYQVFVIMPFQEDFLQLFEKLKEEFQDQFVFTNAGDLDNQQSILKDIVDGIYKSDIILADLTGLNANVFYELGLAHAMNKKVIIITQNIAELPFDIKSYRANSYGLKFYEIPDLIDKLRQLLNDAITGNKKFGNPVSDYVPEYFKDHKVGGSNKSKENVDSDVKAECGDNSDTGEDACIDQEESVNNEFSDNTDGYLDSIVEINELANKLTTEITSIGTEMNDITVSVNDASDSIAAMNRSDVNFARKVCRNLAGPLESFSLKLENHVSNITEYWDLIENKYLILLDNPYMQNADNLVELQKSIESLEELQMEIINSDDAIVSFVSVMQNSKGVERKLTKAITALTNEFDKYLSMTDSIVSSIDRMINKSQIVEEALLKNECIRVK